MSFDAAALNDALAALTERDVARFVEHVAPHVDWKAVEEHEPFASREAVAAYTREWLDSWEHFHIEADEVIPAGEQRAVVVVHPVGRGKDSGVEIDARFYLDIEMHEGLIRRWWEYADRKAALEAAGLSSAG